MQFHTHSLAAPRAGCVKLGGFFPNLWRFFDFVSPPIFLIVLLAAGLRLWHLTELPSGLHGDEGIVGYEAQRIWQVGWIGPYSQASKGQPTGPIYLVAPMLGLLGNQILTVRIVPALVGTLTVLALWGLMRRFGDEKTALVGAFVLATLLWHVHYARIGFPLESWPLWCVFIVWTMLLALEKGGAGWWIGAGFVNGLGVYVYKAHPLFFLLSAMFAALHLLFSRQIWERRVALMTLYSLAALGAASVMIIYALDPSHHYTSQFAEYSTFNRAGWLAQSGFGPKFWFLCGRYGNFWIDLLHPTTRMDLSDGAGLVPFVSAPVLALAVVGFLSWSRRDYLTQFSRLAVLFLPLSDVVTEEAFARRPFALAPFLCVLAAVGAAQLVRWARLKNKRLGAKIGEWAVAALLIGTLGLTLRSYFGSFAGNPLQNWIFCDELTRSIEYMKTLPKSRSIYFYSNRWSINYDTRKFLAPDLRAIDRSNEFGPNSAGLQRVPDDIAPVWVLLGNYQAQLAQLQREAPGGKVVVGPPSGSVGNPSFLAYEISK